MTEIFVQDQFFLRQDNEDDPECLDAGATTSKYLLPLLIEQRIEEVNDKLVKAIRQPVRFSFTRAFIGYSGNQQLFFLFRHRELLLR